MHREPPAVRILPMSDRAPGFVGRPIADVQASLFLRDLPRAGGRWEYARSGLNAEPWTVVLFQFKARVIASATFLRDERFEEPKAGHAGVIVFAPDSIRVFDPIDASTLRLAWPAFRAFGHVKQFLNPAGYATFTRRLRKVHKPTASPKPDARRTAPAGCDPRPS